MQGGFSFIASLSDSFRWHPQTMMLFFLFTWVTYPVSSFLTPIRRAAATPGYVSPFCSFGMDGQSTTAILSSVTKNPEKAWLQPSGMNWCQQSQSALTEKDFISDDPVESRFLPLVKKICECQAGQVADWGPFVWFNLQKFKLVEPRWVGSAIKCWRQHPDALVAAQNSEEIFLTMLDLCDEYPSLEPNRYIYGSLLGMWVHHAITTKDVRSMEHAETHLRNMWKRWEESRDSKNNLGRQHPGKLAYQKLFQGWLNCSRKQPGDLEAYQKALSLLVEMKRLCRDGFTEYQTDDVFQRMLERHLFKTRCFHIRELRLLEGMMRSIENNSESLSIEYSAATRRNLIFAYFQNKQLQGKQAMFKIKMLLDEWWKICNGDQHVECRPNVRTFTQIITTAREKLPYEKVIPRVEALLHEMWHRYEETGDESIKPDRVTYGSFMTVLSKSSKRIAGERAELLLQKMWKAYNDDKIKNGSIKPDKVLYGTVIQVWSKCTDEDSGDKAERLLKEMWDRYNNGDEDLKPSKIHYSQVISAMGSARSVDAFIRAESLHQEMWDHYGETGDESIKPDNVTYRALMLVLSKSNKANAGERAEELLQEMWSWYNSDKVQNQAVKPNAVIYALVIQAWSTSKNEDANIRAKRLMKEIHDRYNDGDEDFDPSSAYYAGIVNDSYGAAQSK